MYQQYGKNTDQEYKAKNQYDWERRCDLVFKEKNREKAIALLNEGVNEGYDLKAAIKLAKLL